MPSHDRICRARCRLYPCAAPPADVRHCLRYDLRADGATLDPWHALTRAQRRKVRRLLRLNLRTALRLRDNNLGCAAAHCAREAAAYRAALEVLRP